MATPPTSYPGRTDSGFAGFLLALVLIGAAFVWLWNERREDTPVRQPTIGVATADSSGTVTPADTVAFPPAQRGAGVPNSTAVAPEESFIAPAPPFENTATVPIGSFLDYAGRMRFDPSRGQDLRLPTDQFGREPMVHLEPLTNLRRLDSLALAQGRILARIRSDVAVADLGLRSGENFLWFKGNVGGPVRAELWSAVAFASPRAIELDYAVRPPTEIPSGHDAWWVTAEDGSRNLWIVCGKGWCHTSTP